MSFLGQARAIKLTNCDSSESRNPAIGQVLSMIWTHLRHAFKMSSILVRSQSYFTYSCVYGSWVQAQIREAFRRIWLRR